MSTSDVIAVYTAACQVSETAAKELLGPVQRDLDFYRNLHAAFEGLDEVPEATEVERRLTAAHDALHEVINAVLPMDLPLGSVGTDELIDHVRGRKRRTVLVSTADARGEYRLSNPLRSVDMFLDTGEVAREDAPQDWQSDVVSELAAGQSESVAYGPAAIRLSLRVQYHD